VQPGKRQQWSRLWGARRSAGGTLLVRRPTESGRPSRSMIRTMLASEASLRAVSGLSTWPGVELAGAVFPLPAERRDVDVDDHLIALGSGALGRPGRQQRLSHQDQRGRVRRRCLRGCGIGRRRRFRFRGNTSTMG
jgi:hypothetical protein